MSEVNRTNPTPSPSQENTDLDQALKDLGMEEYSSINDIVEEEPSYAGSEGAEGGATTVESSFGEDSYAPADVTAKMFRELQSKAKEFKPKSDEEEKILQDLLKEINQGLQSELRHKDSESGEIYSKTLGDYSILTGDTSLGGDSAGSPGDAALDSALGELGIERSTSEGRSAEEAVGEEVALPYGGGDAPPRTEDGKNIYEGDQFSLKVPTKATEGEITTNVIEGKGEYRLDPGKKKVRISKEGDQVIVKVGKYTYEFSKDAKIDIEADKDQISGNVNNKKGNITIEGEVYVSKGSYKKIADKLKSAANKVGREDPNGYGYFSDGGDEEADVRAVLPKIVDAIKEEDEEQKAEKWDSIIETLDRWNTQNDNKGQVNDRGQLLFNVLRFELGEKTFKSALESGAFPENFNSKLAETLTADPTENSSREDAARVSIIYQGIEYRGSLGALHTRIGNEQTKGNLMGIKLPSFEDVWGEIWTHETSANFLNKHSVGGGIEDSEPNT